MKVTIFQDQEKLTAKSALEEAYSLGNWWTWTTAQFENWCNNNLMTDAAIDGTNLSAALKVNLKANNAFTRNAGKLLIAIRDVIKFLVKSI